MRANDFSLSLKWHKEIPPQEMLIFHSGSLEASSPPNPNKGACELPSCFLGFVCFSLSPHWYPGVVGLTLGQPTAKESQTDLAWLAHRQVHNESGDHSWGSVRFLDSDKVGWKKGVETSPIIAWVV